MAEKRDRRPRNEERERDLIEEDVTDTNEDDDQFEDIEGEDEDLDEDVIDEEASGRDRHFTQEIGSEGGSGGDLEQRRAQSGIARGSESTETGQPSSGVWKTKDRRAGRP